MKLHHINKFIYVIIFIFLIITSCTTQHEMIKCPNNRFIKSPNMNPQNSHDVWVFKWRIK